MVRGEIEIARHHAAIGSRPAHSAGPRGLRRRRCPYPLNAYLDQIQYADLERAGGHAAAARGTAGRARRPQPPTDARVGRAGGSCRQPATALRGAAARARRHARRRRPVVSAAAHRCHGAGAHPSARPDADDQGTAADGQELAADADRQGGHGYAARSVALLDFQLVDEEARRTRTSSSAGSRRGSRSNWSCPTPSDKFWNAGVLEPAELHPLRGAAHSAAAGRAVHHRHRRDGRDIPDDVLAGLLLDAAQLAQAARADPIRRSWKKLDIILSTSTEPQFFIDRPHESPFNVGVMLPLEDFLPDQVARLNALHPRPLGDCRRPAAVRPGARASVPDAQGALHGGRQHADLQRRRALCAAHRTTAGRSAIICATTCCACSGSRS